MFHTITDWVPTAQQPTSPSRSAHTVKTNKSCAECRRRRIRCDGGQPCSSCHWYGVPQRCVFPARSKRRTVSRRSHHELSQSLHARDAILEQLFPTESPESLEGLSREDLLRMIDQQRQRGGQAGARVEEGPRFRNRNGDSEEWDEADKLMQHASAYDDVNNLSLTFDRSHSYLGFSSVGIILHSILEISPGIQSKLAQDLHSHPSHLSLAQSHPNDSSNGEIPLSTDMCIDAYFAHVNGITPMLDEAQFRRQVDEKNPDDGPWQALLNMVLVMGAVALGQWKSDFIRSCFHQARRFMNMELLGSVRIESLQALCLLGGYYLHFRSTPNMANAVLGAAFRMAAAMGLHKEAVITYTMRETLSNPSEADMKRRTWWSLFCLDTWASMTLGRPTFGRWNKATMDTNLPEPNGSDPVVSILRASVEFCLLATEIQERFARDVSVTTEETLDYDHRVTNWYNALPASVNETHGGLTNVAIAQAYLRNRYMNLRILLYRPFLLQLSRPDMTRADTQAAVVATCHKLSFEAIANIAGSVMPNTIWAWNSTWYLYQACMVPLFIMATDPQGESAAMCKSKLQDALGTFEALIPWTPAAKRSHSIVKSIFEATQDIESSNSLADIPNVDLLDMDVTGFWDLNNVGLDFDFLLNYNMVNDLEGHGLEHLARN